MKLEFPFPILEKYLKIKFNEIPSSGSRVVYADGQAYGHEEAK
jgi:riboflavin transporter FmnP